MPSKDETVEDRPVAYWAFKEAIRRTGLDIIDYNKWKYASASFKELARMIEKYEKPPAPPELLAARDYFSRQCGRSLATSLLVLEGHYDNALVLQGFLAGVAWAKENN